MTSTSTEAPPIPPTAAPTAPGVHYEVGDEIEVFYRMRRLRGSCMAASCLSAGLLAPRVGISDGWQSAVVTGPPDAYGEYEVRYMHLFWFERGGRRRSISSDDKCNHEHVPTWQMRRKSSSELSYPPPLLSLFVVRWGGFNGEEANAFDGTAAGLWGHAGTSVCDKYINAMCDNFESCLGTNFEVTTAFVQYGSDLEALSSAAPFIRSQLRGTHVAGLYFLWPVAFQDKAGGAAGMVPEQPYFQAVQRLEMTGLPTRFPHPSHLYRNLVSKEWTAHLCLSPELHIPATTKISIASAVRDPFKAAAAALKALYLIKRSQEKQPLHIDEATLAKAPWLYMKGVLKLGFSWEALDVLSFHGVDEMMDRLSRIAEQPGCLTDYVYAQEFIESDCEIRCYVLDDGSGLSTEPAHMRYTRPGHNDRETGRFQGFQDLSREQAIEEWYGGNALAVRKAELEIERLIKRWKLWLLCECSEVQPYMRFDFFVKRMSSDQGTDMEEEIDLGIYTGEMTELGGSTLNWNEGPALIFRSVLQSCLEGDTVPPSDTHIVVRRYEAAHIRFNSEDDDDDDDGDDDENDDSDDDEDGGRYDKKCPRFYESEKQKYFGTFGGSGVITADDLALENGDAALKKAKLSP